MPGTIEANIENARTLIAKVINAGRLDLCDHYLAADRIDHMNYGLPAGMADGHEGFRRVVGGFREAFPDLHLDVQFVVADDDRIMFYISTSGTHRGPFMGMAPTGRTFKVDSVDVFRFNAEGKIAEHWGVFDAFGTLVQLGLVPPAPDL